LSSPQKKQKGKSLEMLLCRTGPCAANQAKPGLEKFAAILRTLPHALQKFPIPATHKATIVLPDFA